MRLLWTSAVRVTTPSTRSASKSLRSREALRSKATRLWMWLLGVGHCPASLIPRLPGARASRISQPGATRTRYVYTAL